MQRYDVQICLVSGQPTPNLVPVFSRDTRPNEVVLLVSGDMKKQAGNLEAVFQRNKIKSRREEVTDPYDIEAIHEQMEKLLKTFNAENPKRSVIVNLTGGTKPMAIAAQMACYYEEMPYLYMNIDSGDVLLHLPSEKYTRHQLQGDLKIQDYLEAHGYSMEEKDSSAGSGNGDENRQLLEMLVLYYSKFKSAIGRLNGLAHEAEEKKTLSVALGGDVDPNMQALLDAFSKAGALTVKDGRVRFNNEKDRFFANGGWLEDAVFDVVKSLGFQDCKKNITVRSKGNATENEIDVAFMTKNRLFLIECKTRRFTPEKGGQNDLNKLEVLSRQLGGLTAQKMLVSYRGVDGNTRKRAKSLNVEVVDADQLHGLRTRIREWVNKVR